MSKVRLGDVVAKTIGGGTPERNNSLFWNGAIPWASVKDFSDGSHKLGSVEEKISDLGLKHSAANLIPAGTPIICTRMAVGRIARADVPVAINQDLRALFINAGYDTDYIIWAIDSIRHRVENVAIGSTVRGINIARLLDFEIYAPDKPEQAKIAEILSTVDRAIEQTEALIAKQQRIKTGLMQDLLTRGIDEHGNLRSESTHQFKDSPLGRIPIEWGVHPISRFGSKLRPWLRTGPFGTDLNTKHWVTQGVPVLTIGSLGEGAIIQDELLFVNHLTSEALKAFRVAEGDIVFSQVADIGRSLVVSPHEEGWIISSNLMRISIDTSRANPKFLYNNIAFNSAIRSQLRTLCNSGGRELVNSPILAELLFPWPDICEQDRIVMQLGAIDEKVRSLMRQSEKSSCVKAALMQELLTGRKRVTALLDTEKCLLEDKFAAEART